MDTLISGVTVVTMNERMDVLFGAYIGIDGGKISYIGKTAPAEQPKTIIEGTGMVAIPGLVNCHTQLAATSLRGLLDELEGNQALEQLLLLEARMDSRSAKAAATVGAAECLRFGITSVSDLYYYPEATAQVLSECGMKGNLALSSYRFTDENEPFDFDTDEQCGEIQRLVEKWHGHDDGRIRIDAGIHSEYTSNSPLREGITAYAAEKGIGMQLHLNETEAEAASCEDRTGLRTAELLACHGFFQMPTTAVGCADLSEEELQLLGKRKVNAVALPMTAARAKTPATDIPKCVKAGMNVALGTGGAYQSGSADLFETMRFAAIGSQLPPQAALMMATVCGARAQGRSDTCGMLKEGMDADIVLVDFSAPHLMPCHNVLTGLVYSAKGGDVAMTMVRGKILYQNGQFPTLDLGSAVRELTGYAIPRLLGGDK